MSNIYVYEQGARISIKENRIEIKKDDYLKSFPLMTIDNIIIFGNAHLTTGAIKSLLKRGINTTWLSKNGNFYGRLESTKHVNVLRQKKQLLLSENNSINLEISKKFIYGKVNNQLIVLKRRYRNYPQNEVKQNINQIVILGNKIMKARTLNELIGYEGNIAKLYFKGISFAMKDEFKFEGRTRMPPMDPFNSMISFGYTLLMYEIYSAVINRGLHPYFGFLHKDKYKHPALCSDLMEEWRPILVDSLAIMMINKNQVKIDDFTINSENNGILLSKELIKTYINMYEVNLRKKIKYINSENFEMSFRKAIDYQVLALVKSIENEDPSFYVPILIR